MVCIFSEEVSLLQLEEMGYSRLSLQFIITFDHLKEVFILLSEHSSLIISAIIIVLIIRDLKAFSQSFYDVFSFSFFYVILGHLIIHLVDYFSSYVFLMCWFTFIFSSLLLSNLFFPSFFLILFPYSYLIFSYVFAFFFFIFFFSSSSLILHSLVLSRQCHYLVIICSLLYRISYY